MSRVQTPISEYQIGLDIWIWSKTLDQRSHNFGPLARTLDIRNKNVTLDPIEKKLCRSGKIAMPDNEIHVSWIKTLDPKCQFLYYYTFFTLLRMVFQNNSDPYWSNSWLARLSPLFHDANHHRYKAVGRRLINELTQIAQRFLAERNSCAAMFVDYLLDLPCLKSYRAIKFSVKENFIADSNFLRQSKQNRAIT